jgi:uncharacterized alpha-E superfamily protein
MLSRVAESIYWMSRYIERAENVARVVDVNVLLQLDIPDPEEQWDAIVNVTGGHADFLERYDAPTRANVVEFLAFDALNPNSILSSVTKARENARSVREMISSEMWEEVNAFYLAVSGPGARDRALYQTHEFFQEVRRASHLVEGTKNETMPHSEAWHFSRLGRFIERADQTSRILDVKYFLLLPSTADVGKPVDDLQWSALLRSASGFEAYRKAFGRVSAPSVAAFLLMDREFPRSVYHCLSEAQESLGAVSAPSPRGVANPAERALGLLVAELHYADATEVIASGLHEFVDGLQVKLNIVGDEIGRTFFAAPPLPSHARIP